jgi:nucleotide-binding universal stress UspA family protein
VRVHEAFPYESTDYSHLNDTSRREQEEYLALMAEHVEQTYGLSPERALLDGPIASTICRFALGMQSPLVVISTHGRTGFSRVWLGSVADEIMRVATAPVLMLRHQKKAIDRASGAAHDFAKVLVPLDGSDFAEEALPHALALTGAFNAKLGLLRVVAPLAAPAPLYAVPYAAPPTDEEELTHRLEGAEEYVRTVARRMSHEQPDLEVGTSVRVSESPARAILEAVKGSGADAIALATHGRGLSRVVMASVTDKVLRGGPDAVLVLRAEA